MSKAVVYLIPSLLDENGLNSIPPYIIEVVKKCNVFFTENERTARRFLKKLWKEMVIDDYEWYIVSGASQAPDTFMQKLKEGKTIGIISEAGCPGVADPGQQLVSIAHEMNIEVNPLVGPNSILLALMASGMNGQQFQFVGYLPVKEPERIKAIKDLEAESKKKNCTQIFIETPYRNNQLIDVLLKNCKPSTRLCIAADLTGQTEWIRTKTIAEWKMHKSDFHKRPAIFCLLA
ncbi:MAG: SAM-dependent methyltransferase [Chitinophagaceae bacterium]|nr:MAG: SAM-dependent methyltransferase [Chitinophagaceae bacterium]